MQERIQLLLLAVLAPCLASLYGLIPPVGGTFRCEDPAIQLPYSGDTVSVKLLLTGVLLPVALLVFLTEASLLSCTGLRQRAQRAASLTGAVFLR